MNRVLNLTLNVIWLVFGGFWLALGYALAGVVCCILIITIPFGIASFRIAGYALWPFGRVVVDERPGGGFWSGLGNIIWLVVAGLWIRRGRTGCCCCGPGTGSPRPDCTAWSRSWTTRRSSRSPRPGRSRSTCDGS